MKYVGSKRRIAPYIASYINSIADLENINTYYEPFMGGCSVGEVIQIQNKNLSDINKYLVALMIKVQEGMWEYKYIEREEWYKIKEDIKAEKSNYPDWLKGWALFGCGWRSNPTAFGGKYIDSTTGIEVNPQEQAYNSLCNESKLLQGISFRCCEYKDIGDIHNAVIYLDPPYRKTYFNYLEKFDFNAFDEWVIEKSKDNLILISEYTMMGKHYDQFIELDKWEFNKGIGAGNTDNESSVERLYYVKNGWLTEKYFSKNDEIMEF